jgi:hypothetical protein
MAAFLEQWAIDEKVMLMAMHSPHGAVKRVVCAIPPSLAATPCGRADQIGRVQVE